MMKHLKKAWVVTVDMGYGHQRAAYPFDEIAYKGIITINNYKGLPEHERKIWEQSRDGYELISRLQAKSVIGRAVFELFDKFQEIPSFYPRRDLSRQNIQNLRVYHMIEKQGVGEHLFKNILSQNPTLPLLCTFFVPAFAAEFYGYPGDIYCMVCDTDVSRTWVPKDPKNSRIKYLAPSRRVIDRLKLYGVKEENIFFTGFPLPKENIGGPKLDVLKRDLGNRIFNLDPHKLTLHKFGHIINYHIGKKYIPKKAHHPLTVTFAVGGAGAQSTIGEKIVRSLSKKIMENKIVLNLIAGTRDDVSSFYKGLIKDVRLTSQLGKGITILHEKTKHEYFASFNELLRKTDVLWTKPSELSFYAGLGLPIIMAPSVGSQEDFNRIWLKTIGGGISQDDPEFAAEWLFDWVENGWLARAALNGFIEAPIMGTYNVERLVLGNGTAHIIDTRQEQPIVVS